MRAIPNSHTWVDGQLVLRAHGTAQQNNAEKNKKNTNQKNCTQQRMNSHTNGVPCLCVTQGYNLKKSHSK